VLKEEKSKKMTPIETEFGKKQGVKTGLGEAHLIYLKKKKKL